MEIGTRINNHMDMRDSISPRPPAALSRTAEYALRAMLALANHGQGNVLAAERLAEMTGTPANYLGKTLYALVKAGLLRSTRGRTGGFALALPPEQVTVARIADTFAEPSPPRPCLLGTGPCTSEHPCAAHFRWSAVTTAAREPLVQTTLADLLADVDPREPVALRRAFTTR